MRRLTLVEHETTPAVRLTRAEREALRGAIPELTLSPARGLASGGSRYDVTAGSWVGVAAAGDLMVEIAPKLPIQNVLFLVSYALDPAVWRAGADVPLQERDGLLEAMAGLFCAEARRALRYGVLHGYETREESLAGVRGRVLLEEHARRHHGRLPPVPVRYDALTVDISENRVLRSALLRLDRLASRSLTVARQVRHLLAALEDVSPADQRRLPEVRFTPLNERYRRALGLARQILRGGSVEARLGALPALACLFDMDRVFEEFVAVALREALGLTEWAFPRGGRGKRLALDRRGALPLEPDLSWWDGARCAFVGDVKYKRTAAGEHADLYQLLAYATAADVPGGLLVYAASDVPGDTARAHDVRHAGKSLHVAALDLAQPPEHLLRQIERLAERVRALRGAPAGVPIDIRRSAHYAMPPMRSRANLQSQDMRSP
ncbi:MAG TPA: restriction endonuclease [Chloroflexota bacterium]|nr:restriction endonuclease [Chloroflexota bacterium]